VFSDSNPPTGGASILDESHNAIFLVETMPGRHVNARIVVAQWLKSCIWIGACYGSGSHIAATRMDIHDAIPNPPNRFPSHRVRLLDPRDYK
jgi:hypothetical protein